MIARELISHGGQVFNYIDGFGGVAADEASATIHFHHLKAMLARLGVQEAKYKAQPPSRVLNWLGLCFNTRAMTVYLTPEKLTEVQTLVSAW